MDGVCTKTGRPVLDVLADKHPALRMPDPDGEAKAIFSQTDAPPEALPVEVVAQTLADVAAKL